VLVSPTSGHTLGFGIGVTDFLFLTLLGAACRLPLRPLATLVAGDVALTLAPRGTPDGKPLPALPFLAIPFALANAALLLKGLLRSTRTPHYPAQEVARE
jgi:hypothetical protein